MERNIRALHDRHRAEDKNEPAQIWVSYAITRFTGCMVFVYIHLVLFRGWIVANLPGVPPPKFDPSFVILAMFASVEAVFLSTFVPIFQNRMMARADQRADLNLQISLLAEHEISRLITLVKAVADHHGIAVAHADGVTRVGARRDAGTSARRAGHPPGCAGLSLARICPQITQICRRERKQPGDASFPFSNLCNLCNLRNLWTNSGDTTSSESGRERH